MKCFHCHRTISNGATICPYCHNKPYIEGYKERHVFARWLFVISGIIAVVGGVLFATKPNNIVAYIVLGMAVLLFTGTVLGLICSWVEQRLKSNDTSWWETTLMFIGLLLIAGLIVGGIFMIFYWH